MPAAASGVASVFPHRGSMTCLTFDLSGPPSIIDSFTGVRRLQDRYQMGVGGLI